MSKQDTQTISFHLRHSFQHYVSEENESILSFRTDQGQEYLPFSVDTEAPWIYAQISERKRRRFHTLKPCLENWSFNNPITSHIRTQIPA